MNAKKRVASIVILRESYISPQTNTCSFIKKGELQKLKNWPIYSGKKALIEKVHNSLIKSAQRLFY
jgi:hypothetical protein